MLPCITDGSTGNQPFFKTSGQLLDKSWTTPGELWHKQLPTFTLDNSWTTPGQPLDNFCNRQRDRKDGWLRHWCSGQLLDNSWPTTGQHHGGGPINIDCGAASQLIFNTSGKLMGDSWTASGQFMTTSANLRLGQFLGNSWTTSGQLP